jgi:uncharacterized protein YkwD
MIHRASFLCLLGTAACAVGGPPLLEDDPRSGVARQEAREPFGARDGRRYTPPAPTSRGAEVERRGANPARYSAPDIVEDERLSINGSERIGAPSAVGADAPPLAPSGRDGQLAQSDLDAGAGTVALSDRELDEVLQRAEQAGDMKATSDAPPVDLSSKRLSADDLMNAQLAERGARSAAETASAMPSGRADALRERLGAAPVSAFVPDPAGALVAINEAWAAEDLAPVRYNLRLSIAARAHVRELARRGEVSALSAGGEGVIARLGQVGYAPEAAASLVAGGYTSFGDALRSWLGDATERQRLLLPEADEIGLALHEDRRSRYGYYVEAIIADAE